MDRLSIILRRGVVIAGVLLGAMIAGAQESILHYSETSDPATLNPLNVQFEVDARITDLLFNSLMGFDMFGRPIPVLLESMEPDSVSPDKRSFTFKLKRGVVWRWYMGKKEIKIAPFTAEDVVFTVNIIKDQRTETTGRLLPEG